MRLALAFVALALSPLCSALAAEPPALILADTALLQEVGIGILESAPEIGVSLARLDPLDEARLAQAAHLRGKCGGFQKLPAQPWQSMLELQEEGLTALRTLVATDQRLQHQSLQNRIEAPALTPVVHSASIQAAVDQVQEDELRRTVTALSSYFSRVHTAASPNVHVDAFAKQLFDLIQKTGQQPGPTAQVLLIPHQSTRQKSIRVRIPGSQRPQEIVVLGGHLDSINHTFFSTVAPGTDDNASGSANLFEALRILLPYFKQNPPSRTIDFFWYAGEEGGLLGSSEIARTYAAAQNAVVGVLQLDMTLFPGDGELTLGSVTDFTSPELRKWFEDLNRQYIGAKIIDDQCGYACSDHASWHSNGYRAIMPFEASMDRMFKDLHTPNDVISSKMSFKHSAMFAKIAVAFALTLSQ